MFLSGYKVFVLSLAVILTGILFVPIEAEDVETSDRVTQVPDRFNRGTPKGSVDGFLLAADEGQYEKCC